jgi:hypothetical protein
MATYIHTVVLEAFRKDLLHNTLVLLLDYAWCCGEYPESTFPHARIWRLTGLEEGGE